MSETERTGAPVLNRSASLAEEDPYSAAPSLRLDNDSKSVLARMLGFTRDVKNQSSQASFESIQSKDGSNLYWTKVLSVVAFLSLTVVLWTLQFTSVSLAGFSFGLDFNTDDSMKTAFTYKPVIAVAIATSLWLVATIGELVLWKSVTETGFRNRNNWSMWVVESISAPIIATTVMACFAQFNAYALMAVFSLTHISAVFGLYAETNNPVGSKPSYGPVVVRVWVGLLQLVPSIMFLSYLDDVSLIPRTAWASLSLYVLQQMLSVFIQTGYIAFLSDPTRNFFPYDGACDGPRNFFRYQTLHTLVNVVCFVSIVSVILAMGYGDLSWIQNAVLARNPTVGGVTVHGLLFG